MSKLYLPIPKRVQLVSPHVARITRRRFGITMGGAAFAGLLSPQQSDAASVASWSNFSVAILGDTQFLTNAAKWGNSLLFTDMMSAIIANRNTVVGDGPMNLKAIIGLGDCQDAAVRGAVNSASGYMALAVENAYSIAFSGNVPAFSCPGNHDYSNYSAVTRGEIGDLFRIGYFGESATRSRFGAVGVTVGPTDRCWYGASYTETADELGLGNIQSNANSYYLLHVGPKRLLIFCVELHPRTAVLNWMQAVMAQFPDYDVVVSTHSYLQDSSLQPCLRSNQYGPDSHSQGAAPLSNSGAQMWGTEASDATYTNPMKKWRNLALVAGGHWYGGKSWGRTEVTNDNGAKVQQIFANWQAQDLATGSGAGSYSDVPAGHVMFLRFRTDDTMDLIVYCQGNGKWLVSGDDTLGTAVYSSSPTVVQSGFPMVLQSGRYTAGAKKIGDGVKFSGGVTLQ